MRGSGQAINKKDMVSGSTGDCCLYTVLRSMTNSN